MLLHLLRRARNICTSHQVGTSTAGCPSWHLLRKRPHRRRLVNCPIRHGGRRVNVLSRSGEVLPQHSAGSSFQRVDIAVTRRDVDDPIRNCRRRIHVVTGGVLPPQGAGAGIRAHTRLWSCEPTYTMPLATAGEEYTASPVAYFHSRAPVLTSSAYTLWSVEPTYNTPFNTAGEEYPCVGGGVAPLQDETPDVADVEHVLIRVQSLHVGPVELPPSVLLTPCHGHEARTENQNQDAIRFMTDLQRLNWCDEIMFPRNSGRLPQGVMRPVVGLLFGEAGHINEMGISAACQ